MKNKPATAKETGDYLYAKLKELGRIHQKKTKCTDADRLQFEHYAVGALLAAIGQKVAK